MLNKLDSGESSVVAVKKAETSSKSSSGSGKKTGGPKAATTKKPGKSKNQVGSGSPVSSTPQNRGNSKASKDTVQPVHHGSRPTPTVRGESLRHAIRRMLQHYPVSQVELELHRWHPRWSAARIRRDVYRYGGAAALPHATVGHGAGQGKPAYQRRPYYRGQQPVMNARGISVYKNPQWSPSLGDIAMEGLTRSQLAYMKRERRANALKFGADAHWIANHPGLVAAALITLPVGPEAAPFLAAAAEALSAYAGGRDIVSHDYMRIPLDVAPVGLARLGRSAAVAASQEAAAAAKAEIAVRRAQAAVKVESAAAQGSDSSQRLNRAIAQFRSARRAEEHLASEERLYKHISELATYVAAVAEQIPRR